jgi:hypothetical protein
VLPFCPFVRGYGAKHSAQYLDLGPRDLREHFELPATAESAYVCSPPPTTGSPLHTQHRR